MRVSLLGFGAGHIGSPDMTEDQAGTILNRAADLGINLFDTARGYGLSEERIGRHLSWRRKKVVIATKVGYGVEGIPDWTPDAVTKGIDRALGTMRTDYIDIVHLHSCGRDILENDDILEALLDAVRQGKVLAAAYSGENEALEYAIDSGAFSGMEASLNICDQKIIDQHLPEISDRAFGFIAKRPLANAFWRHQNRPHGTYEEEYWSRWQDMRLDFFGMEPSELALRFAAFTDGVTSCIVGSSRTDNLARNIAALENGPLPPEVQERIRSAFRAADDGWFGQV
jgi:aryl-alcohol dehydrogenase-like predicted oxidoreductase